MICFCLVNLQTISYFLEAKDENVPKRELMQFISSKISQGATPNLSEDLGQNRKVSWKNILDVGEACLKLDQKSRASTKDLKEIMQRGKVCKAYPLGNHQGSALEERHLLCWVCL